MPSLPQKDTLDRKQEHSPDNKESPVAFSIIAHCHRVFNKKEGFSINKKTIVNNWESLPVVLDLGTVSLIFDVTETTVKRMLYREELKGKKIGNKWMFDRDYIQNFVKEGQVQ